MQFPGAESEARGFTGRAAGAQELLHLSRSGGQAGKRQEAILQMRLRVCHATMLWTPCIALLYLI